MGGTIKNVKMKKFFIVLGALLTIVITVLSSSYIIAGELTDQLQQNLEDVANQNALWQIRPTYGSRPYCGTSSAGGSSESTTNSTFRTKVVFSPPSFGLCLTIS